FHSTLTPPLVTAIFLGVFWKKFTNAAVIGTLVGGVSLMVLGMYYPQPLIQIFDHGTAFDPKHPYTYIGALYNLFVCALFAVLSTLTTKQQLKLVQIIKKNAHHNFIMTSSVIISILIYLVIGFNLAPLPILLALTFIMVAMVVIASNYFIEYKHEEKTDGLTVWSLNKAKEYFKGSKINDREGEKIRIQWKLKDGEDDTVHFSKNDMKRMAAEIGDLVYISDVRKYFGGLKSVHSVYGEPHNEDGLVYIFKDHAAQGQFVEGRTLLAEKEM
ncbi:MAG TPA: sodium:proline symporter, partial [Ignavibacteriales bacterium]|nr:sodium:proline symporter [Ignavibacteriales bacterium]